MKFELTKPNHFTRVLFSLVFLQEFGVGFNHLVHMCGVTGVLFLAKNFYTFTNTNKIKLETFFPYVNNSEITLYIF